MEDLSYFVPQAQYFIAKEFVDPTTYQKFGDSCLFLFDPKLLWTVEQIRLAFGKPVTINNWHLGKQFEWRGYRTRQCSIGAEFSDHRRGFAVDLDVSGMPADQVRKAILADPFADAFKFITCLEININWVHISTRNWDKHNKGIELVNPQ